MPSLLLHTLAYLPAQMLGPLLQLACALALTHALGAADYGLTMWVFASQELVFLVCLSWWTTFYLRYGAAAASAPSADAHAAGGAAAVPSAAAGEATILLVSTAAQVLATVAVVALADATLPLSFHGAACAFTVTRSLIGFLVERARREAAIGAYTALQVLPPAGGLALTLGVVAVAAPDAAAVLALFALAQGLVGAAVAWRLGLCVVPQAPPRAVLRAALTFGAPVVLAHGLSWVATNGIRFVVQHGAGAVALGLLSVGWGLATRLAGVAAMLVNAAAYPLAVRAMERGDVAAAHRQIAANTLLLCALLAPTAVAVAVLAAPLSALLVAPAYHAATIAVLPWAVAGAALRNLRIHGWDSLYLLHEAPRAMIAVDAADAAVMLVGAAAGLAWDGVTGAVIGTTAATLLMAIGDLLWLRHRFGIALYAGAMLRVGLAALAMAGALLLAAHHGLGDAAAAAGPRGAALRELGAAAALGTAVYAMALAVLFPRRTAALLAWGRQRCRAVWA